MEEVVGERLDALEAAGAGMEAVQRRLATLEDRSQEPPPPVQPEVELGSGARHRLEELEAQVRELLQAPRAVGGDRRRRVRGKRTEAGELSDGSSSSSVLPDSPREGEGPPAKPPRQPRTRTRN